MFMALVIFIVRIMSAVLSTLNQIFMIKNKKVILIIISTLDITVWFFTTRYILISNNNFITSFMYILGFALGTYVGIIIEEKISSSYVSINIVTKNEMLVTYLRDKGYIINKIDAYNKIILTSETLKKEIKNFKQLVFNYEPNAVIDIVDAIIITK